jgi:hypothetical protein
MESYIESKFDNVSNVLLTSYFMLQWKWNNCWKKERVLNAGHRTQTI